MAALNTGGNAYVTSVSCASAGNCAAGGSFNANASFSHAQAYVVSEVNGTWGTAQEVPGTAALVLEQNSDACAFYAARGGICVERDDVPPPGGDPARLNGKPMGLRYAWRDVSTLLLGRSAAGPDQATADSDIPADIW